MKNHKVIDIKITYDPSSLEGLSEAELNEKVESLVNLIKKTEGAKVKAKRHIVATEVIYDEFGVGIED